MFILCVYSIAARLDSWREQKQIDDDIKSDEFQDAIDNFSMRRQGIHPNPFYLFIFFPICCE